MLKALRRFTQLLRVHIYVPGCCKYIRMTNGLQQLVELCMDGCFADISAVDRVLSNGCCARSATVTSFRPMSSVHDQNRSHTKAPT